METKKLNKQKVALLVMAGLLAVVVIGMIWFFTSHFFVDGQPYPKKAEYLNLRDQDISLSEYDKIRSAVPSCEIDWSVPFQGGTCPQDITELTLTSLTENDLPVFAYLNSLKAVDATGCRDYDALLRLKEAYPELQVFAVIGDSKVFVDDAEVTVSRMDLQQAELLTNLPDLKKIHAEDCTDYAALTILQKAKPELEIVSNLTVDGNGIRIVNPDVGALLEQMADMADVAAVELIFEGEETGVEHLSALLETYPDVQYHWEKEVFGQVFDSTATEIDISSAAADSVESVKLTMQYFPNAEKVIVDSGNIEHEDMAAFREEMRSEYKVVWTVMCGEIPVRTDETYFMPIQHRVYYFYDEDIYNLRYCEDMICIDVGHMSMTNADWAANMPHLKYLVLGVCGNLKDISGLSNCKELVFLELMNTAVRDYSPLLGCTALEDLNIGMSYGDPEPIMQMTWLKNLWWYGRMSVKTRVTEALPNTNVRITNDTTATRGGWRQLPNYFKMRDVLGMHYML